MYDVVVIGGGTSGLMASIAAASNGSKVLVVEKNVNLGKKLLLTGGGRCNVTNNRDIVSVIQHIPGNGRFLYSCFDQFNNMDIIEFFESRGIELKEEDHGRMFPTTNQSSSIVDTLIKECKKLRVEIMLQSNVDKIISKDQSIVGVVVDGKEIACKRVVLCSGGKSAPKTGTTGDGFRYAESLGHTITPLFASESPLVSNEQFIKNRALQGVSLRDVSLSVISPKGKTVVTHQMDFIFTHMGVSGPAALRCSMFVNKILMKGAKHVEMHLDIVPKLSSEEVFQKLQKAQKEDKEKAIKTVLKEFGVERYIIFLLESVGTDPLCKIKELNNKQLELISLSLKKFSFFVHGTLPIEQSFVTAGGISTKEINPKTFGSKLIQGLYFAGEVVDVNGYTGGYNVTYALCSGYVAGMHAARDK